MYATRNEENATWLDRTNNNKFAYYAPESVSGAFFFADLRGFLTLN